MQLPLGVCLIGLLAVRMLLLALIHSLFFPLSDYAIAQVAVQSGDRF